MKKVFAMENLDCANCAAKMERAIAKLEGVESVNVSFLTQKLTLVAPEEQMDDLVQKAAALCRKVDPDCIVRL